MLGRAYKKILEHNQQVMREQHDRIEELKREVARLNAELLKREERPLSARPAEDFMSEIRRLDDIEREAIPRRIEYMPAEDFDSLLAEIGE